MDRLYKLKKKLRYFLDVKWNYKYKINKNIKY